MEREGKHTTVGFNFDFGYDKENSPAKQPCRKTNTATTKTPIVLCDGTSSARNRRVRKSTGGIGDTDSLCGPQSTSYGTPAAKKSATKRVLSSTKHVLSSKRSQKKVKLTPPRDLASRKRISQNLSSPFSSTAPTLSAATKVPSSTPLGNIVLRSSETEPSDYQLSLPSQENVLLNAKLCHLLDTYTQHNRSFDFTTLAGLSRSDLENRFGKASQSPSSAQEKPILSLLLNCGADDMVIEGFFREYFNHGDNKDKRVEACVFKSNKLRKFYVCFRSSTSLQARPLKGRHCGKLSDMDQESTNLHPDHKDTAIHPLFRSAYSTKQLETNIFALLDNLSTLNPFYDVVMTGHSFGAALATIAATRYASLQAMIRVSCCGFGSPRIGGMNFRQLVHSFPNLKVIRVELASDPYISMPEGSQWLHVGHTIVIHQHNQQTASFPNIALDSSGVTIVSGNSSANSNHNDVSAASSLSSSSSSNIEIIAYRFDKERDTEESNILLRNGRKALSKLAQPVHLLKNYQHHEMESYLSLLTKIETLNLPWVDSFAGMQGPGVSGIGNEFRSIV